jgi:SAM-dependent methyltransferase
MGSDRHWIRLGQIDPYLKTVRTLDPYKLDPNLPRDESSYFGSGERYVSDVFETITQYVRKTFHPRRAVDFGCSVGRVAIPLARRCELVVGLDVSDDMLAEATRNAHAFNLTNVRWAKSDDQLSQVEEPVDLFHSYNVFQHLSVARGMRILRNALGRLDRGGVLAVHVPFADQGSKFRKAINWAQAHVPGIHGLANVARGRSADYPHMLMNPYNLNGLMSLVREHGCRDVHCKLIEQHRYPGVLFVAQVP